MSNGSKDDGSGCALVMIIVIICLWSACNLNKSQEERLDGYQHGLESLRERIIKLEGHAREQEEGLKAHKPTPIRAEKDEL